MELFSTDVDAARYEPGLFNGTNFTGPILCKGNNGQVAGTLFAASGEDFVAKQIQPGHMIYLSDGVGGMDSVYEVLSVNSTTQLTISVLRSDPQSDPIVVGTGVNLYYRIGTLDMLSSEVMSMLTQAMDLRPGVVDGKYGIEDLVDVGALRQLSVYLVLSLAYGSRYTNPETDEYMLFKKEHYTQLASQAKQRCRIPVDAGDDGIIEKKFTPAFAAMFRE